jgi:hypothetical protein
MKSLFSKHLLKKCYLLRVEHNNFGAYFGPGVNLELEGNENWCPNCFPPYDQDECFQDGGAGLIIPDPFTIDSSGNVATCSNSADTPLGSTGQIAVWGIDIDIDVTNTMPSQTLGYFNFIIDWNQNGIWGDPGEHVIPNFYPVPNGYTGPISGLGLPSFTIGPNAGYVWARFTITEKPVVQNWKGDGGFEDGESEDYLLLIEGERQPDLDCDGSLSWTDVKPGTTVNGEFTVSNVGDPGSQLDWEISEYPNWGTWTFTPEEGDGLTPEDGQVTVQVSVVSPNERSKNFNGEVKIVNKHDSNDYCKIQVSLATPKNRQPTNNFFLWFLERFL